MDKTMVYNSDCIEGMKQYSNNYFNLAIVDAPYGISRSGYECGSKANHKWQNPKKKIYTNKGWDNTIPPPEYFEELFRVSENQIIWGGNYFLDYLPATMCMIVWDKEVNGNFSEFEIAWTSFNERSRIFKWMWNGFRKHVFEERFHPTQKPVALYKWLLKNYAKEGDKILDTHLGSQSSRIAAFDMGFDFTGYELDKDYFEAGNKRFEQHKSQLKLDFTLYT